MADNLPQPFAHFREALIVPLCHFDPGNHCIIPPIRLMVGQGEGCNHNEFFFDDIEGDDKVEEKGSDRL
jgi:hypothetical protein